MRDLINLVEGELPITEAMEIVEEYVTHGEVQNPEHLAHFEASFQKLMTLIPRPDRPYYLVRMFRLSHEQAAQISNGLVLDHRKFMSWTTSREVAERLAWEKRHNDVAVIVEMTFPVDDIVVDVLAFYRENHMQGWESFGTYARPEQEVIVAHSAPLLLTPANTKIFETSPDLVPPKAGDRVFFPDDENAMFITQVLDSPRAHLGIFSVDAGHEEFEVRPNSVSGKQFPGEWEVL